MSLKIFFILSVTSFRISILKLYLEYYSIVAVLTQKIGTKHEFKSNDSRYDLDPIRIHLHS